MMDARQDIDKVVRLTEQCTALFGDLLAYTDTQKEPQKEHRDILIYQMRFNSWVVHLNGPGIHKHVSETLSFARLLLESVEENLQKVLELEKKGRESTLRRFITSLSTPRTSSAENLDAIGKSIERLLDLALVLSRYSVTTYSTQDDFKASSDEPDASCDPHTELIIRGLLKSRFPRLGSSLSQRLGDSIITRSGFIASNSRSTKLGRSQKGYQPQRHDTIEMMSGTSVSDPSSTSHPYPDLVNEEFDGECKWCLDVIRIEDFDDKSWKRKHFIEDLQPYICLSDCKAPEMFFSKFRHWNNHMEGVHGQEWIQDLQRQERWYCDIESCPSSQLEFSEASDLMAHVEWAHGGKVTSVQLASMMKRNVTISQGKANICPVCCRNVLSQSDVVPDSLPVETNDHFLTLSVTRDQIDLSEQENEDSSPLPFAGDPSNLDTILTEVMTKHIAIHLKSLAFLSVQYAGSRNTPFDDTNLPANAKKTSALSEHENRERAPDGSDSEPWKNRQGQSNISECSSADLPKISTSSKSTPSVNSEDLIDFMYESLVESVFDHGTRFFPANSLQKLIDPRYIRKQLRGCTNGPGEPQVIELVDYIREDARTLFAILVFLEMDTAKLLPTFRKYNLSDKQLPIPESLITCSRRHKDERKEGCDHHPALEAFHYAAWRPRMIRRFYEEQWKFLVPVITPENRHFRLDSRTILPIVRLGGFSRLGLFSEIHEVEMHPVHCQGIIPDVEGSNPRFALKELRSPEGDSDVLEMFRAEMVVQEFSHPHLLSAISTIIRGKKHYILYPWAHGGNLREYWSTNDKPLTPDLVRETIRQLLGLSEALIHLHGRNSRHGDVKPENILRFMDSTSVGILKLGDMGLAKTHRKGTELRRDETRTKSGTLRYEAPEAEVFTDRPRSRRYDIWSMGCVMLEFAIWLIYGPDGLRDLNYAMTENGTSDAFYSITIKENGERSAEVHHAVRLWLENICNHLEWTQNTAIGDLVRLVRTHLLVVDMPITPPKLGTDPVRQVDRELQDNVPPLIFVSPAALESGESSTPVPRRADAGTLKDRLTYIYENCRADPEYLLPERVKGRPRPDPPRLSLGRSGLVLILCPKETSTSDAPGDEISISG